MSFDMNVIEKRLVVLEQAAKMLERQAKPLISSASLEKLGLEINEILSRPPSEKTQEEQIADFKATLVQMDADWESRYGKS